MRRAGLAAVFFVAASAVTTGCGGHGRPSGTIVFQSYSGEREALFAVRPDGSGLRRVDVGLPRYGGNVYWKPDGSEALVLYDTDNSGDVAIDVFDAETGMRRRLRVPGLHLTGSSQAGDLTETPWSPDGKRLLLATNRGDVVLDAQTGVRRHVRDELADNLVTWSADGNDILFPAGSDVYAAPAAGGPPRRLMRLAPLEPGDLQPSPDGKWISFQEYANGDELYVVHPDGSGLHRIARGAESSAWSPTGERLAFAGRRGVVVADLETGRRRRLTTDRLADPANESPAWSPDGRELLYWRPDLGYGAAPVAHVQLWAMKADGTSRRPVTHAFPSSREDAAALWVEAQVKGAPEPTLPLVTLPAATITTRLPIVALGAEGNRAAVAQGFGGPPSFHSPVGPIVVWNRIDGTRLLLPVRGCGGAFDVVLAAGRVGYRCDHMSEGYGVRDSLRLGPDVLVRTDGGEFTGTFLGGIVAERGMVAFDVSDAGNRATGEFRIHQTRIWKATAAHKVIVRTFEGDATVASLDAGRIAVLRDGNAVSILSSAGGSRTFAFGPRFLWAMLDGRRLVLLQSARLVVLDIRTGRRTASFPIRHGFGPAPQLEDVQGDLAAYVVGVAVHVLRLSDGREIVIDTPDATEPVFARFVPSGLFYSFNESYERRPGRLRFVSRWALEHALASRSAGR